jgi:serine/threonine protein kinase
LFVASDVTVSHDRLSLTPGHSCREFDGWLRERRSGIAVDFRRLLMFCSGLPELRSYLFEESEIYAVPQICETAEIESGMYRRFEDSSKITVKSIWFTDSIDDGLIENYIEHLINLCHPCIAVPIGFVFGSGSRELKVVGLYSESESLSEVIATSPAWWTPTAKAKAVAGLVLGLRFAHSFGLIHGCLTTHNIVFDSDHHIQITDFLSNLSKRASCGFSKEGWNPDTDVRVFASLLFEIIVGRPASEEVSVPADVPTFVSDRIEAGRSGKSRRLSSFWDIFETLKRHDFEIVAGVDSADVLSFVGWVELLEKSREL